MYSDTYKVPGNYYCSQDSTAKTLKNCPIGHAFTMKVESSTGVASVFYPSQTIRGFNTGELFYRIYSGDTETWHDDISYVKRNDMVQTGNITSQYMELTSARIVKTGGIVVASANYTMKQSVTGVNPLISLSFKPATYVPVILNNNGGIITGNIWLNTSGNVGIGGAVTLGKDSTGSFVIVYPVA